MKRRKGTTLAPVLRLGALCLAMLLRAHPACEAAGITVTASAKVTINASTVEVSAGMVTVNAGMSKFSGVVQCDTMISNAVVSASYTPGAGNVW